MAKKEKSVKFIPEQRIDKASGTLNTYNIPVKLRFCFSGFRFEYYTGHRIDTDRWDFEEMRAVRSTNHNGISFSVINKDLNEMEAIVKDTYNISLLSKKPLLVKELREKLDRVKKVQIEIEENNPEIPTLIELYKDFLKEGGGLKVWSKGLVKHFKVLQDQLEKCFGNLKANEVDDKIYIKFKQYLEEKETKLQSINEYRNSTMEKKLGDVKWFLRKKIKDYVSGEMYQTLINYRIKLDSQKESARIKQSIVVLSMNEYELLRDYQPPKGKEHLERVRDVFIFGCHTGLRHSDLKNLKKTDVDWESKILNVTTIKDQDALKIPLSERALSILSKYKDRSTDYALPVLTNQKMNDELKELGKLAGLNNIHKKTYYVGREQKSEELPKWQFLTCHVSRKTFATLAVHLGLSPEEVMEITGHSDYDLFKLYLQISSEGLRKKMNKFNTI